MSPVSHALRFRHTVSDRPRHRRSRGLRYPDSTETRLRIRGCAFRHLATDWHLCRRLTDSEQHHQRDTRHAK